MSRLRTRIATVASAALIATGAGLTAPVAQAETPADLSSTMSGFFQDDPNGALNLVLFLAYMPFSMMSSIMGVPQCSMLDTTGC